MNDTIMFIHEWNEYPNPAYNGYNGYWEITDDNHAPPYFIGETIRIENARGGFHYHTVCEKDEFIYSTWQEIETNRFLKNQDADYGWIDKKGNFYGCEYEEHAYCIRAISNMDEYEAERNGWIKIYRDPTMKKINPKFSNAFDTCYYFDFINCHMTKAQEETLIERGFYIEDY